MENKDMGYRARVLVAKIAAEPNVALCLEQLADEKPQVFLQSVNTAYLAAQLTETYDYGGDADSLVRGALLHDVGMLQVPDEILLKQGRLDDGEKAVVRSHIEAGEAMLESLGFAGDVLDAARLHHERSDGSGYPNGFESPKIPRCAKVILVCDVYEALTTDRPQRKAFNLYEAAGMMASMPLSQAVLRALKECTDT